MDNDQICGRYGEYICDENDCDICSLECKELLLKQLQTNKIEETDGMFFLPLHFYNLETAFYNWRVGAYYKYVTWGSYYTDKDVLY